MTLSTSLGHMVEKNEEPSNKVTETTELSPGVASNFDQADKTSVQQPHSNETLEATLHRLHAETPNEETVRREHEAMEIVMQARESFKDERRLDLFFQIINTYQNQPIKAFTELHNLCRGLPELQELLLDLLTPEQALALDPRIYAQHCLRNDMKQFCQQIRNFYTNPNSPAPQGSGQGQAAKIIKELHNFISQDNQNLKTEDFRNMACKLFKGNQNILDTFLSFLPDQTEEGDRVWKNVEPESIDLSDEENDVVNEDSQQEQHQLDGYEHIRDIPETEEEKLFGTDQCPCQCHPKKQPTSNHCIHCSIRFINGKIYAREGKMLKPVRVQYPRGQTPFLNSKNNQSSSLNSNNISSTASHTAVSTVISGNQT